VENKTNKMKRLILYFLKYIISFFVIFSVYSFIWYVAGKMEDSDFNLTNLLSEKIYLILTLTIISYIGFLVQLKMGKQRKK